MHLEATDTFLRRYKKLPADIKERTKKALGLLETDPAHPSLRHKKMAGREDIFEMSVTQNYRLTCQKIGDTIFLRKVGTRDLLRNS